MQFLSLVVVFVVALFVYGVGGGNFGLGMQRSSLFLLIGGWLLGFVFLSSVADMGFFLDFVLGATGSIGFFFMVAIVGGLFFGGGQQQKQTVHRQTPREAALRARVRELEDRVEELEDDNDDDDWYDYDDEQDEDDYWDRRAPSY